VRKSSRKRDKSFASAAPAGVDATVVARLETDQELARKIADLVAETYDSEAVVAGLFDQGAGRWSVALHFSAPPNETALRALVALGAGADAANALRFERLAAKDWVKASLAGLKPVAAGRFIVHGSHDRSRVPANRIGIEIEAALAFGTGHHGTTRGCLLALDRWTKRRRQNQIPPPARGRVASGASRVGVKKPTPPRTAFGGSTLPLQGRDRKNVLDIGTGTGVLAIAAARALRRPVLASDIDATAIAAARQNIRSNRVAPLVELVHAGGLQHRRFAGARFDLVFANILLGPLKLMARPMARLVAPGGRVVLSGLLAAQAPAALAAYRAQGLILERSILLEGWATLVLKRPTLPR
jgi:ribosomal protein L11 methyltransferase